MIRPLAAFFVALAMVPVPAQAPFVEDFETSTIGNPLACATSSSGGWALPAGWSGAPGSRPWRPWTNATPSAETGPTSDHTFGPGGSGTYLYCETSTLGCGFPNQVFTLVSPVVSVGGIANPALDFWFHLFGAEAGSLVVEETDGAGGWAPLFSTGPGPDAWQRVVVPLLQNSVRVRFIYTSGTGVTGDAAIDDVGFVSMPAIEWNQNDSACGADLNGALSPGPFGGPGVAQVCPGEFVSMNLTAGPAGQVFEIAVTLVPSVSLSAGGVLVPNGDVVNLDLVTFPGLSFVLGGTMPSFQPFLGPFSLVFPAPSLTGFFASTQVLLTDPTSVPPVAFSQATDLVIRAAAVDLSTMGDDDFREVVLAGICSADVSFYGTAYDRIFVNSNGDVSFTSGHVDFTPTIGEWQSQMPRIGVHGDLRPPDGGSITAAAAGGVLTVSYDQVPEFGATGLVMTHRIDFDTITGAARIFDFNWDPGYTANNTVAGISNVILGTHPAVFSFSTLVGSGLQGSQSSDSALEDGGGSLVSLGWTEILFPTGDGFFTVQ